MMVMEGYMSTGGMGGWVSPGDFEQGMIDDSLLAEQHCRLRRAFQRLWLLVFCFLFFGPTTRGLGFLHM